MRTRGIAALCAALLLAGCGGTTPDGLVEALTDGGMGLDPGTTAERYHEAVQGMCDGGYQSLTTWRAFAQDDNNTAYQRMLIAMDYMCPDEGQALARLVEAG